MLEMKSVCNIGVLLFLCKGVLGANEREGRDVSEEEKTEELSVAERIARFRCAEKEKMEREREKKETVLKLEIVREEAKDGRDIRRQKAELERSDWEFAKELASAEGQGSEKSEYPEGVWELQIEEIAEARRERNEEATMRFLEGLGVENGKGDFECGEATGRLFGETDEEYEARIKTIREDREFAMGLLEDADRELAEIIEANEKAEEAARKTSTRWEW
ncbi:MAG: uncharacterized protein A8A55_2536 [Amphiamblys sp. WSBS2006]|nr:MAG: uncharacterized protein A8A55_2536 [Amphiamblys sp. WSBS2006]